MRPHKTSATPQVSFLSLLASVRYYSWEAPLKRQQCCFPTQFNSLIHLDVDAIIWTAEGMSIAASIASRAATAAPKATIGARAWCLLTIHSPGEQLENSKTFNSTIVGLRAGFRCLPVMHTSTITINEACSDTTADLQYQSKGGTGKHSLDYTGDGP